MLYKMTTTNTIGLSRKIFRRVSGRLKDQEED